MRKSQIAIKLSPVDYQDLVDLGNRVIVALTGNASFSSPAVTLVNLQAAVDAVVDSLALWHQPDGNYGSHESLVTLQQQSLALWLLLRAEADYVQTTSEIAAGSDYAALRSIMTTSGYSLRGDGTPQGPLQAVQNFHHVISRTLAPNELMLKWKRPLNVTSSGNVKSYKLLRGNGVFSDAVEIAIITKTTFIDTNTTGATQTWFYWVTAINNAGESPPSEVVMVTVLSS